MSLPFEDPASKPETDDPGRRHYVRAVAISGTSFLKPIASADLHSQIPALRISNSELITFSVVLPLLVELELFHRRSDRLGGGPGRNEPVAWLGIGSVVGEEINRRRLQSSLR